jgi:hypothetical protein
MVRGGATECFDYHRPRVVPALLGLFVFAVGLHDQLGSSSRTATFFLIWGPYLILNALRPPVVAVDEQGATTSSLLRTHRYSFAELQSVEVARARTGFPGFGREHLLFRQANGRTRAYRRITAWPPKGDPAKSIVRRAAMAIDARLRAT